MSSQESGMKLRRAVPTPIPGRCLSKLGVPVIINLPCNRGLSGAFWFLALRRGPAELSQTNAGPGETVRASILSWGHSGCAGFSSGKACSLKTCPPGGAKPLFRESARSAHCACCVWGQVRLLLLGCEYKSPTPAYPVTRHPAPA